MSEQKYRYEIIIQVRKTECGQTNKVRYCTTCSIYGVINAPHLYDQAISSSKDTASSTEEL